jgi:hypothetical protein
MLLHPRIDPWALVTFQRGARLITGISGLRIEDVMPAEMPAPPTSAQAECSADGRARGEAGGKLAGREEPEYA